MLALGTRFVRGDKSNKYKGNESLGGHEELSGFIPSRTELMECPRNNTQPTFRRVDGKTNNIVIYSLSFAVIGPRRSAVPIQQYSGIGIRHASLPELLGSIL